jgi:hypothetical protein
VVRGAAARGDGERRFGGAGPPPDPGGDGGTGVHVAGASAAPPVLLLLGLFLASFIALAAPAFGRRLRPLAQLLTPPALAFALERPG